MPGVHNEIALDESTHDSLKATIVSSDDSSRGIKAFSWKNSSEFDLVAKIQEWREGVCELENAERGDEGGQAKEIGDRSCDNERYCPLYHRRVSNCFVQYVSE
jgi:hypothetical protein